MIYVFLCLTVAGVMSCSTCETAWMTIPRIPFDQPDVTNRLADRDLKLTFEYVNAIYIYKLQILVFLHAAVSRCSKNSGESSMPKRNIP